MEPRSETKLYEWNEKGLEPTTSATFEAEQLLERDLQCVLRDAPEVLEEGLFVVAEEYGNWRESGRSIDLLALDSKGRLVVVELKRTLTGNHMDLQAVRYAAMVANMTFAQVVEAHRAYLVGRNQYQDGDAAEKIREHLGEPGDEIDSSVPRILLASGDFSSELTTSVLWLNDNGLDITCVRLDLHRSGEHRYLSSSQVIPLPEARDYQIRIRDKKRERPVRTAGVVEFSGADQFRDSIRSAPMAHQEEITKFYDWAMTLREKGVCSHYETTFSKRDGYGLKPLLRHGKKGQRGVLVSIYNSGGPPRISVWLDWFKRYAPNSIPLVEKEMGHEIGGGNAVKGPITDDLLNALFKAHQEATRNIKVEESGT